MATLLSRILCIYTTRLILYEVFRIFYCTHLVIAIEFTDEKYSLHTSMKMLKFNLSTVENIDYQVNHSGYEIKITTYTWWSHSLLCTFSTTSLESISISTIYTFDYWISHWRPLPAQSKSNKITKYINSRHSRKSKLEPWIVTLSVAYP